MPVDGDGPDKAEEVGQEDVDYKPVSDKEVLEDESLLKVCGNSYDVAADSLALLNQAVDGGRLQLIDRKLSDESFMRVIKAIGIIAKLKNLLPRRTSVLPITEVDLSGNTLLTMSPHPLTGAPELSQKSLQPLQLTVQFVRVSTDAKVVRLDGCNLQGTSHDKDDKVEQEVIRLVKKFGAGKDTRYAREVSLVGNKFEAEFAKKIIEAAYWERTRVANKDNPPKLSLDLRRNRIRAPHHLIDELRAGRNAGGAISVATTEDPAEEREKALIVVDLTDQLDRSVTPVRGMREPTVRPRQPSPPRQRSESPAARKQPSPRRPSPRRPSPQKLSPRKQSPPRQPSLAGRKRDLSPRASRSADRPPSPRGRGRSTSPRGRGRSASRGARSRSGARPSGGAVSPARGTGAAGGRRGGQIERHGRCSQSKMSNRSEDSRSPSPSPEQQQHGHHGAHRRRHTRRRHHHHHRRHGKRHRMPSRSYSDSVSPSPRRHGHCRRKRHRRH